MSIKCKKCGNRLQDIYSDCRHCEKETRKLDLCSLGLPEGLGYIISNYIKKLEKKNKKLESYLEKADSKIQVLRGQIEDIGYEPRA